MGACEQCFQDNCYSSGCNSNCKQSGSHCYTEWMGGGDDPLPQGFRAEEARGIDYSVFTRAFIVLHRTDLMRKAGIEIGSLITHVNGKYPDSSKGFGEMIKSLPSGTVLRIFDVGKMNFEDVKL